MREIFKFIWAIFLSICLHFKSYTPLNAMQQENESVSKQGNVNSLLKDLPFPYLAIDHRKREDRVFVLQGTYVLFGSDSPTTWILGPLRPDIAIIAKYKDDSTNANRGLVANLDYSSNITSIISEMKKIGNNKVNWEITLYTTSHPFYDTEFKQAYENRTQLEELRKIKDEFVNLLKLERSQVTALKFTDDKPSYILKEYAFIDCHIAIEPDGKIYTAAVIKDDLYKYTSNGHISPSDSIEEQIEFTYKTAQSDANIIMRDLFNYRCERYKQKQTNRLAQTYGFFPLTRLNDFADYLHAKDKQDKP